MAVLEFLRLEESWIVVVDHNNSLWRTALLVKHRNSNCVVDRIDFELCQVFLFVDEQTASLACVRLYANLG